MAARPSVVESAQLTGPVEPPRPDPGLFGDVAKVPRAREVVGRHYDVTAAANGLFSRPSSARAMLRMCTSSGPSNSRIARCQP